MRPLDSTSDVGILEGYLSYCQEPAETSRPRYTISKMAAAIEDEVYSGSL